METDSFFYQLLQKLPDTLFDMLGLPLAQSASYRFDSVELKKSLRIDGLFVPKQASLPVYFVEFQFQRQPKFYANLFAKVFLYLEARNPNQEWVAVAIFPNRGAEPKDGKPYEDLLNSPRVRRLYLEEIEVPAGATLGLRIVQLVSAPTDQTRGLVEAVLKQARQGPDSTHSRKVIELVEEILIRRFKHWSREEIRHMFQLHDLRETRVWQEAHEEGLQKGLEEGLQEGLEKGKLLAQQEMVGKLRAKGRSTKEIADELGIPLIEVRRLARKAGK